MSLVKNHTVWSEIIANIENIENIVAGIVEYVNSENCKTCVRCIKRDRYYGVWNVFYEDIIINNMKYLISVEDDNKIKATIEVNDKEINSLYMEEKKFFKNFINEEFVKKSIIKMIENI